MLHREGLSHPVAKLSNRPSLEPLENTMSLDHDAHMLHGTSPPTLACDEKVTYPITPSTHLTNTCMPALPNPASNHIVPARASSTQLVSVYRSDNSTGYIFQCNTPGCTATFSRWHEFLRHDNAYHGGSSVLWCPMVGCSRSKTVGNNPYPKGREDKMREHVRKVHGAVCLAW
jgi:hypothetical protein